MLRGVFAACTAVGTRCSDAVCPLGERKKASSAVDDVNTAPAPLKTNPAPVRMCGAWGEEESAADTYVDGVPSWAQIDLQIDREMEVVECMQVGVTRWAAPEPELESWWESGPEMSIDEDDHDAECCPPCATASLGEAMLDTTTTTHTATHTTTATATVSSDAEADEVLSSEVEAALVDAIAAEMALELGCAPGGDASALRSVCTSEDTATDAQGRIMLPLNLGCDTLVEDGGVSDDGVLPELGCTDELRQQHRHTRRERLGTPTHWTMRPSNESVESEDERCAVVTRRQSKLSFEDAIDKGMTSDHFDLQGNLSAGDTRKVAVTELMELMGEGNRSFDEARVELVRRQMRRAGIDPDTGLPIDEELGTKLKPNKSWGPNSSPAATPPKRARHKWLLRFISG